MSLILLYKPESIKNCFNERMDTDYLDMMIKKYNIIGFTHSSGEILKDEIKIRLKQMYFNEDEFLFEIPNKYLTKLIFKGSRINEEINKFIKKDEDKLKEDMKIEVEFRTWQMLLFNEMVNLKQVFLYCQKGESDRRTKDEHLIQKKALRDFLFENVFKYIEYDKTTHLLTHE